MSKNYEPTIEGHYEKCCDERHALQMQLEEYQECFANLHKEHHELWDDFERVTNERDEARREICTNAANELSYELGGRMIRPQDEALKRGWDCYKEPYCFRVNGVVVSKGKAVPPKFELGEDDK